MSLKPPSCIIAPPRTVRLAVSATWFEACQLTAELALSAEPVPLILPPVAIRSPVMALVVLVVPMTPKFRMTPCA